jgi:trehalose-6-phosphate synthase
VAGIVASWKVSSAAESRSILRDVLKDPVVIVVGFNNPLTGGGGIGTVMRSLERHLSAFNIVCWNPHAEGYQPSANRWIWPVDLPEETVAGFHRVFLKQYVWPCLHGLRPSINDRQIAEARLLFEDGNRRFVNAVVQLTQIVDNRENIVIWLNDYALAWCVSELRTCLGNSVKIGLSFRCSFGGIAPPEFLAEDTTSLSNNLSCADFISFHRSRDVHHLQLMIQPYVPVSDGYFIGALQEDNKELRRTYFRAIPMGNDPVEIHQIASDHDTAALMETFRTKFGKCKIIASIGRLEHHKNVISEIEMYSALLAGHPELVGQVTVVRLMPIPPEYRHLPSYVQLQQDVEAGVADLNRKYGSDLWKPYHLLSDRFYERNEVVALLRLADVVMVTSSADGFSHIPLEALLSKEDSDSPSVLLLSDVGSTEYLSGAFIPLDNGGSERSSERLFQALSMDIESKQRMFQTGKRKASSLSAHQWATSVLTGIIRPDLLDSMTFSGDKCDPAP